MQQEDLQKALRIRESVMQQYKLLDGGQSPSTAVLRQFCESLMSLVDDLLGPYVNFS
mgnify:CR=1 FL=1